jgi:hypothetical protein
MSVPSLNDVCGGGEDQLHIRDFSYTPGNGITRVHALLCRAGTESSCYILDCFLTYFPDRWCEFWLIQFHVCIKALFCTCLCYAFFLHIPYQFTPLLNLCSLIFCLMLFGWFISIYLSFFLV